MTKENKEKMLDVLYHVFNKSRYDKPDNICLAAIAIALVEQCQTASKIKLEFKNCSYNEEKRIRTAVENALADSISQSATPFKRIDQDCPLKEI